MTGNSTMLPKRNLWPLGIVLSFALFVAGTASLVVMAARNSSDLVSANYYDDEVRFQTHIDELNRARNLAKRINVQYDSATHNIVVVMPADHSAIATNGRIELYRPSAARFDKSLELIPDAAGVQLIDTSRLAPGLWIAKIVWTVDDKIYRHEQKLVIGEHNL